MRLSCKLFYPCTFFKMGGQGVNDQLIYADWATLAKTCPKRKKTHYFNKSLKRHTQSLLGDILCYTLPVHAISLIFGISYPVNKSVLNFSHGHSCIQGEQLLTSPIPVFVSRSSSFFILFLLIMHALRVCFCVDVPHCAGHMPEGVLSLIAACVLDHLQ